MGCFRTRSTFPIRTKHRTKHAPLFPIRAKHRTRTQQAKRVRTKHEHEHAPLFRTKHEHTQNTEQNTNTEHPNTNTRFRTPEKTKQKPEHEHAFPNARTPFGANPGKTSLHLGRAWIHPWILAMNGSMDEHEHMAMSILFFTPQSIIKNLIKHKMRKIGILKKMEN